MSHMDLQRQRFFVTAPSPCPYLEGKMERKLFTRLTGPHAPLLNEELNQHGFRRSQSISYRPICEGCVACRSIRVRVDEFNPSRNFRRIINKNDDILVSEVSPIATQEQFHLLQSYLNTRHDDGDMASMDEFDYAAMVEDTPVGTGIVEYRSPSSDEGDGHLIASCLTDRFSDGLSMVYSFFDTSLSDRSLGTFMVLDHIRRCRDEKLPFLYLGYWIKDCQKMSYKARYQPAELLTPEGWMSFGNSSD